MALLMKPEPFAGEFNRLFNTLFDASQAQGQRWSPAMDLVEAEDHFVLKADLPGLGEEDISIEIQDNTLTLSGERRSEHETAERGWYRVERAFGRFSRSLTLPEGVDAEGVSAAFDKGVLDVRIPKPEQRKPRQVQIAVGSSESRDAGGNGKPAAVEGTAEEK
ncbi:MAG: Hsp20/alpha crystallin family protein [Actinomycetota bacterium]|nr:Hsp20/alpha crystallin family protein [Actinomycetota bacterium]